MILKEKFDDRSKGSLDIKKDDAISLTIKYFIPFTQPWKKIRSMLKKARVIYIKCDLNELIILLYFGGLNLLRKTVAGVQSPWTYPAPINYIEKIHNYIYTSRLMKALLHKTKMVHVLKPQDKLFFETTFSLKNVELIPNYTKIPDLSSHKIIDINPRELRVIFVGELLLRKGVDILMHVIKNSPRNYKFDIAGEGPMRQEVVDLAKKYSNCKYHGYLNYAELLSLLNQNDVLFAPSRAEGFSTVVLEAMSVGLKIVDSPNVFLNLPKNIEYVPTLSAANSYIEMFDKIYEEKKNNSINRAEIRKHFEDNFSKEKIMPVLLDRLFQIN
jgi:glycosyltransferase involved in cell wall biosynthesis